MKHKSDEPEKLLGSNGKPYFGSLGPSPTDLPDEGNTTPPVTLADLSDNTGETILISNRYLVYLKRRLGIGGMGEVYLAVDSKLNREVAVKFLRADKRTNSEILARFFNEMNAAKSLTHPNIIHVYDCSTKGELPYFVMEYSEGGTLLDLCDGKLPLDDILHIGAQICSALHAAHTHEHPIIHRDVKPTNILLTKDGIPKLSDFGLARCTSSSIHTQIGTAMGTPCYMSPEQSAGLTSIDLRTDIYSLGITLYHLTTGVYPQVAWLHQLPDEIRPIITRATQPNPDDRYATSEEMLQAINAARLSLKIPSQKSQHSGLQRGVCYFCKETNAENRKFCDSCGKKLTVLCLNCRKPMQIWDKVCDSCGCKQQDKINDRMQAWQAKRIEAIKLIEDGKFAIARKLLRSVDWIFDDARLYEESLRRNELSQKIEETEKRIHSLIELILSEGEKAVANSDLATQIDLVEKGKSLPEWAQQLRLTGRKTTIRHFQSEVQKRQKFEQNKQKTTAKTNDVRTSISDNINRNIHSITHTNSSTPTEVVSIIDLASQKKPSLLSNLLGFISFGLLNSQQNRLVSKLRTLEKKRRKATQLMDKGHFAAAQKVLNGLDLLLKDPRLLIESSNQEALRDRIRETEKAFDSQIESLQIEIEKAIERKDFSAQINLVDKIKALPLWAQNLRRSGRTKTLRQYGIEVEKRQVKQRRHEQKEERNKKVAGNRNDQNEQPALPAVMAAEQKIVQIPPKSKSASLRRLIVRAFIVLFLIGSALFIFFLLALLIDEQLRQARLRNMVSRYEWQLDRSVDEKSREMSAAEKLAQFKKLHPQFRNSIGMIFQQIPAGSFMMGSPISEVGHEADEKLHQVTITSTFYMGIHEVMRSEYQKIMGTAPDGESSYEPVGNVDWKDIHEFIRRLNNMPEENIAGWHYRLPTEAEWEYCYRAGSKSAYHYGGDSSELTNYGWFKLNSYPRPHPVGLKLPNAWGLFDMSGNVWELCSDWYGPYTIDASTDPLGPGSGKLRVRRGGSWKDQAAGCRAAYRNGNDPSLKFSNVGFRLVLIPSRKE